MSAVILALFLRSAAGLGVQGGLAPSLDEVLRRAGRYSVAYGESLSSVLAEETYTQRLVWRRGKDVTDPQSIRMERRLRSEIAFVPLVESTEWLAFRNVLAVDGIAVPAADGRLERLFRGPSRSLLEQARLIASDSARYNIGPVTRDVNTPTTALHFVHPVHQPNCRFNKEGVEELAGKQVWVVRFRERGRGGLISGSDGTNLPAEGRLWIVPADGRVVRSELVVKNFVRDRNSTATIDVVWRREAHLDMWVPAEMREHYEGPWFAMWASVLRLRYDIDGVATYSNYRRFTADFRIK